MNIGLSQILPDGLTIGGCSHVGWAHTVSIRQPSIPEFSLSFYLRYIIVIVSVIVVAIVIVIVSGNQLKPIRVHLVFPVLLTFQCYCYCYSIRQPIQAYACTCTCFFPLCCNFCHVNNNIEPNRVSRVSVV